MGRYCLQHFCITKCWQTIILLWHKHHNHVNLLAIWMKCLMIFARRVMFCSVQTSVTTQNISAFDNCNNVTQLTMTHYHSWLQHNSQWHTITADFNTTHNDTQSRLTSTQLTMTHYHGWLAAVLRCRPVTRQSTKHSTSTINFTQLGTSLGKLHQTAYMMFKVTGNNDT